MVLFFPPFLPILPVGFLQHSTFCAALSSKRNCAAITSEHRRLSELGLCHASLLRRIPQRDHAILDQLGQGLPPAALFPLLTALLNALLNAFAPCDFQRRIEIPFHARHVVHLRLSPSHLFYRFRDKRTKETKEAAARMFTHSPWPLPVCRARTAGRIYYGE